MLQLRWAWSVAAAAAVVLVLHCAAGEGADGSLDPGPGIDSGPDPVTAYDAATDVAPAVPDARVDASDAAPAVIDAGPPPDASAFFAATRVYRLAAKHSGQSLSVESSQTTEGANVQQRIDDASGDQRWTLRATTGGDYEIVNVLSHKCLDVAGASMADNGKAVQATCAFGESQRWRLASTGQNGYYELVDVHSGKCLDVAGGAMASGANVIQWSCSGSDNQLWRVISDEPAGVVGAHDPSMIKVDNAYYLFTTGGTLGVRRSFDLVTWTDLGTVFGAIPAWIAPAISGSGAAVSVSDLWAPDISYFNNAYHLYYAASVFGKNTSVIGLATNATLDPGDPSYKWVDQGLVVQSTSTDNWNAIDPSLVLDATGTPWLSFGSFWSGIKMRRIDPTTGRPSIVDVTSYALASRSGGAIEAPSVLARGGFYYLFTSFDDCCKGALSTYSVRVGRAKQLTGPYVDRNGTDMSQGAATPMLSGQGRFHGPGGQSILMDGNEPWLVHHYYDAQDNGAPKLRIAQILWTGDGWPVLGEL